VSKRILVTGTGVIASIGAGAEEFQNALYAGKCGIGPSTNIGSDDCSGPAAEVWNFAAEKWLGKGIRTLDRSARLLCVATQMALFDSGLDREPDGELGLVCGTMFGGLHSITSFDWSGVVDGPKYVNPMEFPNTVINSPAGQAAIRHKLRGVNSTISAGLASGLYAIHYAAEFLRLGRAEALLAGAVEELCQESFLGFHKLNLVSQNGSIKAFGEDRDGTIPGEGSAAWMIETEEHARGRKARCAVEICGFGEAHDAHSIRSYHLRGDGARSAIEQALRASGISAAQIGLIVASANGSRSGDEMEARALASVFGGRLGEIPICAPKAAFGEAMGASGMLLAVTAGMALLRGLAPPTPGAGSVVSGLRLAQEVQPIEGEYALVNCFGCDGNNAALVLKRMA